MKAIHNVLIDVIAFIPVVVNIIKSKNESNSQLREMGEWLALSCCKYH